jgi:FXSXX-COOH protein
MSLSVQESAVVSDLPDLRDFPIAEVAATVSPEMANIMRRIISDPERPAVSAFNSSI